MVKRLALGEASGTEPNVQVNVQVNQVEEALDANYVGEVMDRLAKLGVVPEPLPDGIEDAEVVDET